MSQNTPQKQLFDMLVSKNFDIQALDSRTGRGPVDEKGQPDMSAADEFRFDFVTQSGRNYGSVVVLFGDDNNLTMFFGDNVGKGMEGEDKKEWFDFLYQMKQFATKNFLDFQPENITRLKYTKQGQAAIKEGLFESWQGKGNISWNGQPTEARLVIKHKKALGEGEARFRFIESIYIETADNERFKLKSRSLTAAKAMLEHIRQGGNPYDTRAQHINEIVEELGVLSRFRRANANKVLEGDTKNLVEQTDAYYKNMHSVLKHLGTSRGYQGYFESWTPADVNEGNLVVEDLKQLFVEQTIDHRIEEALPILARITQEADSMKEAQIFESWINNLVEGTWALPETPEQKQELIDLMSKDFPVGPDATNATEQLYNILGDDELFDRLQELADADANADARSVVMTRLQELSDQSPDVEAVLGQLQTTNPAEPEPDDMAQDVAGDEQLPQNVEEGVGNIGTSIKALYKKIYNAGDDEIEYFYNDSPIFAQYWDEYEGDLNSIIAEVDPTELQIIHDELESYIQNANLEEGVAEASPEATFNALKGLKSWQVMIMNNFYNGKYPDYSGRNYYVLATSPEEARQVVLDNADGILQDLLSMKSHNGKKILPRNSAVRITPERIIRIKDGTEAGRMSTAGFKRMFGPNGVMMVKLVNGAVADIQGQQDVAEGAFKKEMHAKAQSMDLEDFVEQYGYLFSPGEAEQFWHAVNDVNEAQCNMTAEGEYCPEHGLEECGIYEYTGNVTNFGLEESDELARLKKLALNK